MMPKTTALDVAVDLIAFLRGDCPKAYISQDMPAQGRLSDADCEAHCDEHAPTGDDGRQDYRGCWRAWCAFVAARREREDGGA